MEKVILESPYAGATELEMIKNVMYAEFCMRDCLVNHDEAPFASHLLYTREFVLEDRLPEQRELGIQAGFEWRGVAEKTVFYQDLGMTGGMKYGLEDCEEKEKKFEIRLLPKVLLEEFLFEYNRVAAEFKAAEMGDE